MDNVIKDAFTKYANPGTLYNVWVFDPQTGEVDVYDGEEHSLDVPSHQDLAQQYPHEERVHGYAYRIINGWRVTDWEDKPLTDPFVLRTVTDALRASQGRTGHNLRIEAARRYKGLERRSYSDTSYSKWAWIEGQRPETWEDTEVGGDNDFDGSLLYQNMRDEGLNTQDIDEAFEGGTAADYAPIEAHFEKIVELASANPKLAPFLTEYQGKDYTDFAYSDVADALNQTGVKWAVGTWMTDEHGDDYVEVGAKAPSVTDRDINANVGPLSPYGTDTTYGMEQNWNFQDRPNPTGFK